MKNTLFVFATLSLLIWSGCGIIKMKKLGNSGEVQAGNFVATVPYESKLNLIILDVVIKGKTYKFLLDSGAPNVASPELVAALKLSSKSTAQSSDSQGENSALRIVTIPEIVIGGISFTDIQTAVTPLGSSDDMKCLSLDGIVGSNLMRKAAWKIDYQRQEVTIANSIEAFEIASNKIEIPFKTTMIGQPYIALAAGSVTLNRVIVDLGSNGSISLTNADMDKVLRASTTNRKVTSYGIQSVGAFGKGANDSSRYCIVAPLSAGELIKSEAVVNGSAITSSLLGNEFLKNYDVIFDWKAKKLLLNLQTDNAASGLSSFGFNFDKDGSNLVISRLFEQSSAAIAKLQLGDVITGINGVSCTEITDQQYCELRNNSPLDSEKVIDLTILREDGDVVYRLTKTNLL